MAEIEARHADQQQGAAGEKAEGALGPVHLHFGDEEDGEEQSRQHTAKTEQQPGGQFQGIATHDSPRLADKQDVGGQQRVGAQTDFEVVDHAHRHAGEGADQIGRPAPPGEEVPRPNEQQGNEAVDGDNVSVLGQIGLEQGDAVHGRVGHRRQQQGQHPDAHPQPRQGKGPPVKRTKEAFHGHFLSDYLYFR